MSERFSAGIANSDLFGDNYSVMNTAAVSRWVEEVYPRYRQRLADALRIRQSELSRYERALGMPEARVFALLLDHYERDSAANFTEWANSMIRNAGSTSAAQFWSQAYRTFNRLVQEYQGAKQMHPAVTSAGAQFMPGYRAFPYAKSYTSNLNIPTVGQLAAAKLLLSGNKETKKESTTKETKESTTHQELVPVAPSPSAQKQAESALAPYKETLGKLWDAAVQAGTALAGSAGGTGLGAAAAAWIVKQIMGHGASGDNAGDGDTASQGKQEASVKIEQIDDEPAEETKTILKIEEGSPDDLREIHASAPDLPQVPQFENPIYLSQPPALKRFIAHAAALSTLRLSYAQTSAEFESEYERLSAIGHKIGSKWDIYEGSLNVDEFKEAVAKFVRRFPFKPHPDSPIAILWSRCNYIMNNIPIEEATDNTRVNISHCTTALEWATADPYSVEALAPISVGMLDGVLGTEPSEFVLQVNALYTTLSNQDSVEGGGLMLMRPPRSIWDSSSRLVGYTGFAGGRSKRRMPFQSPRKFIGGSYSWDLPKLIKLKTRKLAGAGIKKKKSQTLATKTKSKTRRK